MAIISSGALTMTAIRTEFGGTNPTSLSEYYRNGAYTTSNNTGVPTTGAISMSQFYSTTAADYVPNALAWSDISSTTDDQGGSNYVETVTQTLAGINQTITLLVDTSNWGMTVAGDQPSGSGTLEAFVGGVSVAFMSLLNSATGASSSTASRSMTFTVSSGSVVKFGLSVNVSDGIGYATGQTGATFSVKNNSSGNTVLDTFMGTCGASTSGGA